MRFTHLPIVLVLALFASCHTSETATTAVTPVASVVLTPNGSAIIVGQTTQFTATELNATLQDPAVREKLVALGHNPAALGGTRPADFSKLVRDEVNRIEALVRDAKITLE